MPCPHSLVGDPKQCSQCRGAAAAVVTRGPDGALLINGRPANEHKVPSSTFYPLRRELITKRRREAADRARTMDPDFVPGGEDE